MYANVRSGGDIAVGVDGRSDWGGGGVLGGETL